MKSKEKILDISFLALCVLIALISLNRLAYLCFSWWPIGVFGLSGVAAAILTIGSWLLVAFVVWKYKAAEFGLAPCIFLLLADVALMTQAGAGARSLTAGILLLLSDLSLAVMWAASTEISSQLAKKLIYLPAAIALAALIVALIRAGIDGGASAALRYVITCPDRVLRIAGVQLLCCWLYRLSLDRLGSDY